RIGSGMTLSGWQRLWVVLMAVWAIPIALIAFNNRPTSVYHDVKVDAKYKPLFAKPSPDVLHRMPVQTWVGIDCGKAKGFDSASEDVSIIRPPVPVRLCFGRKGLSEPSRKTLDGIVQRMIDANEPDDAIKSVVEEFKRRASAKEDVFG